MSLARRLMASTVLGGSTGPVGQVEYETSGSTTTPQTFTFKVPAGVTEMWGVAIGGGLEGANVSPFQGASAGNLHWNSFPVTPGEWLTIQTGTGQTRTTANKESSVKRGSTYLLRATLGATLYHTTLGGGGGQGGAGGSGVDGNGGLGGGGPGYTGKGGKGGNYFDTTSGAFPEANSGGGRGGDQNGVPTGYVGLRGEGTGLLGRSPDKTTSLGPKSYGAGSYWAGSGLPGAVRLLWGGGRTYPDNAPDRADGGAASFVSAANGVTRAFTFHGGGGAQEGDIVVLAHRLTSSGGSFSGIVGSSNWNAAEATSGANVLWKQVDAADLAASAAGTISIGGTGSLRWATATYRGGKRLLGRTAASAASGGVTLPGFPKRIDSKRVIAVGSDQNVGSGSITFSPGFTSRVNVGGGGVNVTVAIADKLSSSYTDGSSVTGTTGTSGVAALIELY